MAGDDGRNYKNGKFGIVLFLNITTATLIQVASLLMIYCQHPYESALGSCLVGSFGWLPRPSHLSKVDRGDDGRNYKNGKFGIVLF